MHQSRVQPTAGHTLISEAVYTCHYSTAGTARGECAAMERQVYLAEPSCLWITHREQATAVITTYVKQLMSGHVWGNFSKAPRCTAKWPWWFDAGKVHCGYNLYKPAAPCRSRRTSQLYSILFFSSLVMRTQFAHAFPSADISIQLITGTPDLYSYMERISKLRVQV